jgi:transposase
LSHALGITTADITDRQGALSIFTAHRENLSEVGNVMVDGVYTGQPFVDAVKELIGAKVEVVEDNALSSFVVILKR